MTIPRHDPRGDYTYENGPAVISGSFQIVAGPVMGVNVGDGFVATRVGVGDYLVTLNDSFFGPIFVTATVRNAANNVDMYAQIGTITPGAAPTIQIRTKTAGANTEVPNDDWVHFEVVALSEWLDAATPRHNPIGMWMYERGMATLVGRFTVDAVPDIDVVQGQGFAVTRTGAGDYLITFTDGFVRLLGAQVSTEVTSGAAVDLSPQVGAFTAGAAGACTLQVLTKAAAVNTEIPADDAFHFMVTLYGEALEGY
jgi:hypothetical protein